MANKYHDLQILRAIREDVSQPSMAKEIGFSLGKVNFILQALIEKGLSKQKTSLLLTIEENINICLQMMV